MATAAKRKSKATMRVEIIKWLGIGANANPRSRTGRAICDELVAEGLAYKEDDGYWATDSLRRAKAATKMGAESTPSRSRQVAARPNRQPDTTTYSGRIARRMRKLRKAKKMSIDEMRIALESAGVVMVNSALYAYENGNRQINPDHYPALAKVLGCESVRDFLPSR